MQSIPASSTGYVHIKRFDLYAEKAVPTGKVEGDKAEFLLLTGRHLEGKVWLRREEIY
jgi:hypothetical protein